MRLVRAAVWQWSLVTARGNRAGPRLRHEARPPLIKVRFGSIEGVPSPSGLGLPRLGPAAFRHAYARAPLLLAALRLLHVMAGIEAQAPAAPAAAGLVAACGAPPILQNPPSAEETRVAFDSADPEQLYVFDGVSLPIEVQAKNPSPRLSRCRLVHQGRPGRWRERRQDLRGRGPATASPKQPWRTGCRGQGDDGLGDGLQTSRQ